MKNLTRLSKKTIEFCEFSGIDSNKLKDLIQNEVLTLTLLTNKKEMDYYGVDYAYPYAIFEAKDYDRFSTVNLYQYNLK